ncbi:MAG: adenylate/guanylate cyclase domain-containing protein [Alphaproteobacteria bacterium]|nr:adenylate/guanylate cyclase domain-containing protein [Alphaproteobacteria bacterium]
MDAAAAIVDWLVSEESRLLRSDELVEALADRLLQHVPVWRISTAIMTMHPDVAVVSIWWTAEDGVRTEDVDFGRMMPELLVSPVNALRESSEDALRIRLDAQSRYALLERFREQGATDYLIMRLPGRRDQMFSVTTKAPGGFEEAHLALLLGIRRVLSLRLELSTTRHINRSLLRAYLGQNVAQRVLHGEYRRAVGQRIQTIVFTCDLRGFTERVDHRPLEEVLEDLDAYFECVAEPWVERGGEVLKFIGDAVLGIFPVGDDPAGVARLALDAARDSFVRLAERSAALPEGRLPLAMGYVLHAGEVAYGNIGSRARIDFTVIGRPVNEAARLEKLTKELAPLVLSDAFVDLLGSEEGLVDLGSHALRGVQRSVRLFTPEP